jgi:hypothetical protein
LGRVFHHRVSRGCIRAVLAKAGSSLGFPQTSLPQSQLGCQLRFQRANRGRRAVISLRTRARLGGSSSFSGEVRPTRPYHPPSQFKEGIKPWLDEEQNRPGTSWQTALGRQIRGIRSAAILVGDGGLGPRQNQEIQAFLNQLCGAGPRHSSDLVLGESNARAALDAGESSSSRFPDGFTAS